MTKVIEPGITRTPPPDKPYSAKGGDVTTYRLREMSQEQIERYGLTRYVRQQGGDNDDKQRS